MFDFGNALRTWEYGSCFGNRFVFVNVLKVQAYGSGLGRLCLRTRSGFGYTVWLRTLFERSGKHCECRNA